MNAEEAKIRQELDDINRKIKSGVKQFTLDGMSGTVDLDHLREVRNELERKLATIQSGRKSSFLRRINY